MTMTPEAPAKTLTQLVANEIRFEMVRQDNMRQSELARRIGKNEQWLSVRLRGKQPIDVNDLALIARGLGVRVHQLLPDPDTTSAAEVEPSRGSSRINRTGVVRQPKRRMRRPIDRPPTAPTHSASPVHPSQRRPSPVRLGERRIATR